MKRRPPSRSPRPGRLFAEPERPGDAWLAHVDGASRNNPGPAAYGIVLRRPDGSVAERLSKYIGVKTNNEAEYFGLIAALDAAAAQGVSKLRVRSDSELLTRQMQGAYRVKSASLRPLHEQAQRLARRFAYLSFEHVPRVENAEADRLANDALDRSSRSPAARSRRASSPAGKQASRPQRLRARYSGGVLHPLEPLDLPEGEEIDLTLHRRSDSGV